ncbi:DUF6110 family protein [Methanosphaera sp. ISO3-F5]|uniref:DUF6110 family protein n=1 Tax=Methanosphaera sp. ISO3-F5 TaxID=1452353 RepID=UPI002B25FB89|nr:DUF6110 family protein [Methanosphaera sp. ISO3-F5]WQH63958.1 DUF6110 family protein [Methanosphaera sp. ISO3-F5]
MVFNRNGEGNGIGQTARDFFGSTKVKYFIAGAVCAYAAKKICETEAAHDFAVNLTAGALDIKDSVEESIENIREDAEDIHTEAQEKQQIEIFGPEDLEDEDEEDLEDEDEDKE